MEIKVIKFTSENKEQLEKAFQIRTKVFVEEQNVDKDLEYDGLDKNAIHYLVYYNKKAVGTARRRITKEGHKLERFAVYKEYREKKIGAALIVFILKELLPSESKIYLNAQAAVEKFYEKYGFKRVGEMFTEANIEHYKMEYAKK
ncbi:MAG: GNAT family N-acetyltransferase [Bacteroidales bacterium]|nr:GNAT family N-acetyltransferase [Bacteroidales bacterium]